MAPNCKEDTDSVTRPYFVYAIFCVQELYSRLCFKDREWENRRFEAEAEAEADSCLVGESFSRTQYEIVKLCANLEC